MSTTTILLNLAYFALVSSTMFRAVLWLRLALLTGAILFVIYGISVGLTSIAVWNTLIATLHAIQLRRYLLARRGISLSEEDERLRATLFPGLDRFDFFSLWSMGESLTFIDTLLTAEGTQHDTVMLVLDGTVEVRRGASVLNQLGHGSLVGEMSFLSGRFASADSYALGEVRVRLWPHGRLEALDQLNPAAARALHEFIARDLANKLT